MILYALRAGSLTRYCTAVALNARNAWQVVEMDVGFSRGGIAQGVCAACRYCPARMLRMPGARPLRQPPQWLMQNGFITHTCTAYAEAVPFKHPGNHRLGDCRTDMGRYHVQRGCLPSNPFPPMSGRLVGADMADLMSLKASLKNFSIPTHIPMPVCGHMARIQQQMSYFGMFM